MNRESEILRIKSNPVYQELNAYYSQSTVFSTLGVERNENRHSSFLCWLLSPNSDHQLGIEPLKKFLALYASANEKMNAQMRAALITGRFDVDNFQIGTEVALSRFCSESQELKLDKKHRRLDIWAEFSVVLPDAMNSETVALIIENKIYSKEGIKDGLHQTDIYHDCLRDYYHDQTLLEVFLTAPEANGANCLDFIHLNYQQLSDYVLQPVFLLAMNEHSKMVIGDYIRNLGRPALNDDEQAKTYSILATSAYEREKLQQLLNVDGMKKLIEDCLCVVFGDKVKKLVGKDVWEKTQGLNSYDVVLLTEFWYTNMDIMKALLHTLNIFPGNEKLVDNIFKESNRDTTKYFVEKEDNGRWIAADANYKRPLAKGRAACVFFTQWLRMHDDKVTFEEARTAFPVSINQYYASSKWDFLDGLIYRVETRSFVPYVINAAGKDIKLDNALWDFYPVNGRQCGWGYSNNNEKIIMVKMWRKGDFQLLLEHIDKHPELFKGLRIRQA